MRIGWPAGAVLVLAGLVPQNGHPQEEAAPLESFSFVVGNWAGTFKGHPSPRVPQGFTAPGTMVSRWGPQRAWIESEASTEIPVLGPYTAKVVVRFDPRAQAFDSFVVTTAGTAARYTGTLSGNKVVFVGQLGEIWQRVTYENLSSREMRFRVEESHDTGATYRPHSEALWRRQ